MLKFLYSIFSGKIKSNPTYPTFKVLLAALSVKKCVSSPHVASRHFRVDDGAIVDEQAAIHPTWARIRHFWLIRLVTW
ncbi:hypothetical protein Y032_0084g1722 [Ancylostoma ceylanicum]|uniref:Uncharacterized protein n=1 Tax=Ancylostoma ceylanicum TaxID=53326 RepID=A0A016TQK8_9BILA|nr:hypothetical protein Y032_0084g1722 [Ancylostoma ceylanicum]